MLLTLLATCALNSFSAPLEDPLLIPEHGLTVQLGSPDEYTVASTSDSGQVRRSWKGKLGRSELTATFFILPASEFRLKSPEAVVELIEWNKMKNTPDGEVAFAFEETRGIEGQFGFVPYAWLGVQTSYRGTMRSGNYVCIGGIGQGAAWTLEVSAEPALTEDEKELLIEQLAEAVTYEGENQVLEWTDEEVAAEWEANAPDRVLKQSKLNILRTDHYIIMTDMKTKGGTGRKLAKKMEERYKEIKELYPFQEIKGRRLMPIYIFRDAENYYGFLVKALDMTMAEAERTAGIASGEFYATSYEDPGDPVHIHEMTHQIFRNRLRLSGGGSWFQEGVAEYIESTENKRKEFRKSAKRNRHMPLRTLFARPSLIFSSEVDKKGGDEAGDLYLQSACIIEFLAESKFGKGKFQRFLHSVGSVRRNDLVAIEDCLRRIYAVDIEGLEEEFLKYWKKR